MYIAKEEFRNKQWKTSWKLKSWQKFINWYLSLLNKTVLTICLAVVICKNILPKNDAWRPSQNIIHLTFRVCWEKRLMPFFRVWRKNSSLQLARGSLWVPSGSIHYGTWKTQVLKFDTGKQSLWPSLI